MFPQANCTTSAPLNPGSGSVLVMKFCGAAGHKKQLRVHGRGTLAMAGLLTMGLMSRLASWARKRMASAR